MKGNQFRNNPSMIVNQIQVKNFTNFCQIQVEHTSRFINVYQTQVGTINRSKNVYEIQVGLTQHNTEIRRKTSVNALTPGSC